MSLAVYFFFFPITGIVRQSCLREMHGMHAYLLGFCHPFPLGSMCLTDKEELMGITCLGPEIVRLAVLFRGRPCTSAEPAQRE